MNGLYLLPALILDMHKPHITSQTARMANEGGLGRFWRVSVNMSEACC